MSPNEKEAKEKYGDEYYVDEVEIPTYFETYYDTTFNDD